MARGAAVAEGSERALVEALRAGDEAAFASLIDRYGPLMLRVARTYVRSRALAEDVVQEAWLGVLNGIGRFEERSSLKTWIFRILTNVAKTRAEREGRSVPFSALAAEAEAAGEPADDPSRFNPPSAAVDPGHWSSPPAPWEDVPEDRLLTREVRAMIEEAIADLPPGQRMVITLRDIQGWDSAEVCNELGLTETNQRVLLHRARSKVRRALERYLQQG